MRELYNQRNLKDQYKNITFVLIGAFDPKELIKDKNISPFNIAIPIEIDDFNINQVSDLVKLKWPDNKVINIAQNIFSWTNGQPFLTQLICEHLPLEANPKNIENYV